MTRLFLGTVALVALYFLVPVEVTENLVLRAALSVGLIVLVTVLIYWEIRRQVRQTQSPIWGLGLAVVAGLMVFALTDYVVARNYPGEFEGLVTRLDGLYFALTTLATVGYGDVHAAGQLARAVVCFQQAFNIVVLASATSVILGQLRSRAASRAQSASK